MTDRKSNGQRNRAKAKRLRGIQNGAGRISKSLGANDPRHYRNDQGSQATDQAFGPEFEVDKNRRLRLKDDV